MAKIVCMDSCSIECQEIFDRNPRITIAATVDICDKIGCNIRRIDIDGIKQKIIAAVAEAVEKIGETDA